MSLMTIFLFVIFFFFLFDDMNGSDNVVIVIGIYQ